MISDKHLRRFVSGSTALAVLLALGLVLAGCGGGASYEVAQGETMGTTYMVKAIVPSDAPEDFELGAVVEQRLARMNAQLSTYDEESEISQVNRQPKGEAFTLGIETHEVFQIALELSRQTGGAFDVTIGPVVNAWGFGPEDADKSKLAKAKQRVGYDKLRLDELGNLIKMRDDVYSDLSAIAKGYAVDDIGRTLERAGIANYMVEVGGEVRVLGRNQEGAPWRLGIQDPEQPGNALITSVAMRADDAPLSLATSGDYRNYVEADGKKISHVFNAQTKQPIEHNVVSVSVLHESCAWADGWATALLVLGDEHAQCFSLADEAKLAALFLVEIEGEVKEVPSMQWKEYMAADAVAE